MESVRDIRLLLKVIQAGSFSAAGRQMGLSPAAVSRRVSALEQTLRTQLFYRTSRRLNLTEVGQNFAVRARDIVDRLDELEGMVSEYQESPRGLLHVHTRVNIGERYLAPMLSEFQTRYPDIQLKLWLSEEQQDLIENKIDVAIRLGNLDEPSLAVRKLWDGSPRILVATPGYLQHCKPILHPRDLEAHNCLTYLDGRFSDGRAAWRFRRAPEAEIEVQVRGSLQVNNADVLRDSVLGGVGLCLLPGWIFGNALNEGRLVHVLPDYASTAACFDHHIYLVYDRSRYVSPKIRAFVNFCVAKFREMKVPD